MGADSNVPRVAMSLLREDIEDWEAQARLWDDPRVADLENVCETNRSAKEIGAECRAKAEKLKEYVADLSGPRQAASGPASTSKFNEPRDKKDAA